MIPLKLIILYKELDEYLSFELYFQTRESQSKEKLILLATCSNSDYFSIIAGLKFLLKVSFSMFRGHLFIANTVKVPKLDR
jgi:hypothetical protein